MFSCKKWYAMDVKIILKNNFHSSIVASSKKDR